jgi:hypothetical protein
MMDTERIAHLKDKLQTWPGEMALTSTDIADLLALLDEKAEQIKAGAMNASALDCVRILKHGGEKGDIRLDADNPSPGLSPEDERALLWLENECQDCPKCLEFIATLRSRLTRPAPPVPERIKELMVAVCQWQTTRDLKKYPWTEEDKKAFGEVLRILQNQPAPPIWVDIAWLGRFHRASHYDEQVKMLREKGVEVIEKP